MVIIIILGALILFVIVGGAQLIHQHSRNKKTQKRYALPYSDLKMDTNNTQTSCSINSKLSSESLISQTSSYGSLDTRVSFDPEQYGNTLFTKSVQKSCENMNQVNPRIVYSNNGLGIFAQSDPFTEDLFFNHLNCDFGIILNGSWPALKRLLDELNSPLVEEYAEQMALINSEKREVHYKLLFLAQNGHSYDELGIQKYGPQGWEDYWSKQNGDGDIVWGPDAKLTLIGEEQAYQNSIAWKEQLEKGVPAPQAFYVSPLQRALDTLCNTWTSIERFTTSGCNTPNSVNSIQTLFSHSSAPLVVEDLRGTIGVHTSDRRNSTKCITQNYPRFRFETDFTMKDILWTEGNRETTAELNMRTQRFIDFLFNSDWDSPPQERDVYISITTHSEAIRSILNIVGHRPFKISDGGMIPVLVKAIRYTKI